MKRYDPEYHAVYESSWMQEDSEGEYVLYEEAKELLEALEALCKEIELIEGWEGDCPWLVPVMDNVHAVISKVRTGPLKTINEIASNVIKLTRS